MLPSLLVSIAWRHFPHAFSPPPPPSVLTPPAPAAISANVIATTSASSAEDRAGGGQGSSAEAQGSASDTQETAGIHICVAPHGEGEDGGTTSSLGDIAAQERAIAQALGGYVTPGSGCSLQQFHAAARLISAQALLLNASSFIAAPNGSLHLLLRNLEVSDHKGGRGREKGSEGVRTQQEERRMVTLEIVEMLGASLAALLHHHHLSYLASTWATLGPEIVKSVLAMHTHTHTHTHTHAHTADERAVPPRTAAPTPTFPAHHALQRAALGCLGAWAWAPCADAAALTRSCSSSNATASPCVLDEAVAGILAPLALRYVLQGVAE